ncbi:MAG: DUF1926 domain-containing protein [Deltaproteobacteria bacterium]|nr:DUF1926 domain-containing protein [Deltaproteobacteria bacterium]
MTYFLFCIHNHQPVGNFGHVLEQAYEDAYRPFLKTISKHPSIKLTLHTSGFLLDWLIENRPEYMELLRSMAASGQVELMGGGYYEPILPVIPYEDRVGQIRMMADRLEAITGQRPRGLWLAERVWEPSLPPSLKDAGVEYILVDDYHFIRSGIPKERLTGYYITEDQGSVIKVFPGSEALRYLMPFKPVPEFVSHLPGINGMASAGSAAIYGDDGEKFGVWPGTRKSVYGEGWLERFFERIESLDWLKCVTYSEYIDRQGPLGRVYLPATSYMEMGEWSLPAEASKEYAALQDDIKKGRLGPLGDRLKRFTQGGTWRNFFSKYPESNWMHKRMLHVSRTVGEKAAAGGRGEALKRLYMAQCNDAYWHGIFGGLYLPHLRTAVYENLIKAEDAALQGASVDRRGIETKDIDADGAPEVVLRTGDLNIFVSPELGAGIYELDFRPKAINLLNTLSRRPEGYHSKLTDAAQADAGSGTESIHDMAPPKEKGLAEHLKFDPWQRGAFVESVLLDDTRFDDYRSSVHKELGGFRTGRWSVDSFENNGVRFSRSAVYDWGVLSIRKEISPTGRGSFSVNYALETANDTGAGPTPTAAFRSRLRFAVEVNLILPCCDGPACFYRLSPETAQAEDIGLKGFGEFKGITGVSLVDSFLGVEVSIEADSPLTLWRFPVYTVSLSEAGFEKNHQGSCLVFLMPLTFGQNTSYFGFNVKVKGR